MAVSDYLKILQEHEGQWLTHQRIARIWNASNPTDTRKPEVIRNALKKRGRPDVIVWADKGKTKNYRFKAAKKWKAGMCKFCQDPVPKNRVFCNRCK